MFYMKWKNEHKHTDTHLDVRKTDGFILNIPAKKKVWLSYVNYFRKKKNARVAKNMGRNDRNDFAKNNLKEFA